MNFYWIFISQIKFETVPIIERFEENSGIPKSDWYLVCEQTKIISKSTKLRAFFFRSCHKLLFSNSTKHKMGVINYSKCHFCPEENQTEEHMLFHCPVVHTFWNLVRLRYVNIFRTPITEYEAKIGDAGEHSQHRLRKNVILLHT